MYKVNAQHQIGIATAQETGLSTDRYPIRIRIANGTDTRLDKSTGTDEKRGAGVKCKWACSFIAQKELSTLHYTGNTAHSAQKLTQTLHISHIGSANMSQ